MPSTQHRLSDLSGRHRRSATGFITRTVKSGVSGTLRRGRAKFGLPPTCRQNAVLHLQTAARHSAPLSLTLLLASCSAHGQRLQPTGGLVRTGLPPRRSPEALGHRQQHADSHLRSA